MKQYFIILITIMYLVWVMVSFFILDRIAEDLRGKHPSLIDKHWKRILWLLGCFLFIPILMIPCLALEAVKEFISGNKN